MSRTLKPCPFCGNDEIKVDLIAGGLKAWCSICLAVGPTTHFSPDGTAQGAWNDTRCGEEHAEADAARWHTVRDLVRKIDAEARPGGVMADDDVLDVVIRILRRAARPVEGALNQVEGDIFAARGIIALHLHWDQVAKLREQT